MYFYIDKQYDLIRTFVCSKNVCIKQKYKRQFIRIHLITYKETNICQYRLRLFLIKYSAKSYNIHVNTI